MNTTWQTSTYSGGNGCVQARWAKSSYSAATSDCVEARQCDGAVQVRDSKDSHSPILQFGPAQWAAFITAIRTGQYDR